MLYAVLFHATDRLEETECSADRPACAFLKLPVKEILLTSGYRLLRVDVSG